MDGAITRNEYRQMIGMQRLDVDGMDEIFVPANMIPIANVGNSLSTTRR